jgi:hypothetical protein
LQKQSKQVAGFRGPDWLVLMALDRHLNKEVVNVLENFFSLSFSGF